jgi:conjugative transfer signal peptidase TraF
MNDRHSRTLGFRGVAAGVWNRRPGWAAVALVAGTAALGSLSWRPRPVLLWNATPSSPPGLYAITSAGNLRRGELVAAWAPGPARRLAAERNYLPSGVPLVKPISGIAGDRVCAKGNYIFVNARLAAARRPRDSLNRPMPSWSGCRVLRPGELFLLSKGVPRAFDGRYFGVTRRNELVGKATLLWRR